MRGVATIVTVCTWLILIPRVVSAQASITGVVRDTSGAVMPGVTVETSGPALIGPQIAANYVASNAAVAPSLGRNLSGGETNVTVNLVKPGTMYGERLNQLDLRVAKVLRFGRIRTALNLDVYNALNGSPVLQQSNVFGNWQQPQGILVARFAKVSLQVDF